MRSRIFLSLAFVLFACKGNEPAPPPAAPTATPESTTRSATVPVIARPAASTPAARVEQAPKGAYGWKDQVTLTGRLVEKEVLGAKGGSIKTTFLVLDAPISVRNAPGEQIADFDGESELWYAGKTDTKALVGKRVTYNGGLEPMQTGHHHSNVWLTGDLAPATK